MYHNVRSKILNLVERDSSGFFMKWNVSLSHPVLLLKTRNIPRHADWGLGGLGQWLDGSVPIYRMVPCSDWHFVKTWVLGWEQVSPNHPKADGSKHAKLCRCSFGIQFRTLAKMDWGGRKERKRGGEEKKRLAAACWGLWSSPWVQIDEEREREREKWMKG